MEYDGLKGDTHHVIGLGDHPLVTALLCLMRISRVMTVCIPVGYITWVTLGFNQGCIGSTEHWARDYMQTPQLGGILATVHLTSGMLFGWHTKRAIYLFDGIVHRKGSGRVCTVSIVCTFVLSVVLRLATLTVVFPPADICPSNEDSAVGTFARRPCRNHSDLGTPMIAIGISTVVVDTMLVAVLLFILHRFTVVASHSTSVDMNERNEKKN